MLQHADNPVDWREWDDDAFDEAVRRDVPVLLSVGYAACHWCHVMAHESFEDEATARLMNENFVCIKVDREERPDVDAVYMNALQLMTRQGGWPMTVFLTPTTRAPYYAGTYYPATPRYGSPSFRQVLAACKEAWDDRRDQLEDSAVRIVEHLAASAPEAGEAPPGNALLSGAIPRLAADFDAVNGGFGGAPKFPPPMTLIQLMRHVARLPDAEESAEARTIVSSTCRSMARGGIYDQLAGGFCRYSTDATWTVPHFEKMLYDNALLLRAYTEWWLADRDSLAERIARETAHWMIAELRTDDGAFASSLDADSDGVEGAYYVWTAAELADVLGAADGAWAADLLGVTETGTFEGGASVLQLRADPEDDARWARVRATLGESRHGRTRPGRDDKIVAAWNGLAISALARAGKVFDDPDFLSAAEGAAEFVRRVHMSGDRLVRTSRLGTAGTSAGVLEDYGAMAGAFLDLYQATGDGTRLRDGEMLLDAALTHFAPDPPTEFFDTADDAEQLIVRGADPTDNATPSGRSALAEALVASAALTGSERHRTAAHSALAVYASLALGYPRFAGWGLAAAEALADGPRQIAIVEAAGSDHRLQIEAWNNATAGGVVAVRQAGAPPSVPLVENRTARDGLDTAYVCRGFVCDLPTSDPAELRRQLAQ